MLTDNTNQGWAPSLLLSQCLCLPPQLGVWSWHLPELFGLAQLQGCIFPGEGAALFLRRDGAPALITVLMAAAKGKARKLLPGQGSRAGGSAGAAPEGAGSHNHPPLWLVHPAPAGLCSSAPSPQ